jgi:hypothetical protein
MYVHYDKDYVQVGRCRESRNVIDGVTSIGVMVALEAGSVVAVGVG